MTRSLATEHNGFVIPAKAGIHHPPLKFVRRVMAPRLRVDDESLLFLRQPLSMEQGLVVPQ
jgi:hypothetical protein